MRVLKLGKIFGILSVVFAVLLCTGITAAAADGGKPDAGSLKDNGSTVVSLDLSTGKRVTVRARFEGGSEPYTYTYSYKSMQDGSGKSYGPTTAAVRSFILPGTAAEYSFSVTAMDASGATVTVTKNIIVEVDTGKELSVKLSGKTKLSAGSAAQVTAEASGGSAPYKYLYSYAEKGGKRVNVDSGYIYSAERTVALPSKAGIYNIFVSVRGSNGDTSESSLEVNTLPLNVEKSRISKTIAAVNEKITLYGVPENYDGKVRYHYSYHRAGKPWVYLGDYVDASSRVMSFDSGGTYYARVGAKDESGKYSEKQFKVTVKELDVSGSKLPKTVYAAGESIKLTSSAANVYGTVRYHYSYHMQGKAWTYLGDYTTSKTASFRFGTNGIYYLRVGAKDSSGKYKEKQFCIYVYSTAAKKTIKASPLQSSANWASGAYTTVPSGASVNVITTSGHWFMVKYGKYTGWLYNLALGSYKNYSGISASTVGSYCDDLIFEKGKSIKALFECVSVYPYRSANDFSYEENIAYIIKYRRGACYQHTCYLDFLLKRAGYQTKMVYDGQIKRGTGWIKHTWVIVKTADGWRHIDATPVRETGCAYLVKDSYLGKYFYWNTKKYPECV